MNPEHVELEAPASNQEESYEFPCSIVQRTCWFLDRLAPGSAAYNIAVRFLLHGPLNTELFEQALQGVIDRHEVLRTRFRDKDGEPRQIVDSAVRFHLEFADLRHLAEAERQPEAERQANQEAMGGFDLEKGPLFRGKLVRTGDEEFMLLLTMHHIISDGWSVGIVTDEMGAIYGKLVTGKEIPLPELSIQYADYSCWQEEWAAGGSLEEHLGYWKKNLAGFRTNQIATDLVRPAIPSNGSSIRSIVLPRQLTDALKEISDKRGCTLFMTILAAFSLLMRDESGEQDLFIRTQTAGRTRLELEPLIGWFVNSLILRVDTSGELTFPELLERVKPVVLDAFDHQEVPFEYVMKEIRPRQAPSRIPPFQFNLVFQRDFVRPWERAGIRMTPIPSKSTLTFVDLNFFLVERNDGWRLSVDVNTDVFLPETGDFLLRKFKTLLETLARKPNIPLAQIEMEKRPRPGLASAAAAPLEPTAYVAPRTKIEEEIIAAWEQVLNVKPIGIYTNFFDLGGHSLLAVQLVSLIQEKLGHRIQLADLFADPTPASMARSITGEAPAQDVDLIRVQPRGSQPPFFMVGGDHWFRPMALRLNPDQPFLGLSLQRYEKRPGPTPFAEIAEDLAKGVRTVQPHGPYFIGGWCVDGAIAFETARRLIAAGETVGLIALMDSVNPEYRREYRAMSSVSRLLRRTAGIARDLTSAHFKDAAEASARLSSDMKRAILRRAGSSSEKPAGSEYEQDLRIIQADPERQEFRRLLYISEESYTPGTVSCPVVLIRSAEVSDQSQELGWKRVSQGPFELVQVDGDHISMFREPHVAQVAEELQKRLSAWLSTLVT